jgi:hypothetical protein
MSRFLTGISSRRLSTTARQSTFKTGPSPPPLPPKEQEEFERLQRTSTGAFSSPHPSVTIEKSDVSYAVPGTGPQAGRHTSDPQINRSLKSMKAGSDAKELSASDVENAPITARFEATGHGEELHPDIRRGAKPEFVGDVNPVTGEIGGPKNDPLRWGSTGDRGDWSYNGRVTDF